MKTNTYIDKIKTRNMVKVEKNGYIAYSYEDYFWGEWVGTINVFKDNKPIIHATARKALTEEDLEKYVDTLPALFEVLNERMKKEGKND